MLRHPSRPTTAIGRRRVFVGRRRLLSAKSVHADSQHSRLLFGGKRGGHTQHMHMHAYLRMIYIRRMI